MYRLCPLSLRSFARKVGPATALTLPEMCMTVINTHSPSLPPGTPLSPTTRTHKTTKMHLQFVCACVQVIRDGQWSTRTRVVPGNVAVTVLITLLCR